MAYSRYKKGQCEYCKNGEYMFKLPHAIRPKELYPVYRCFVKECNYNPNKQIELDDIIKEANHDF